MQRDERAAPAGFPAMARATEGLRPPYAVVDLGALDANALDMVRRAAGKPIRLASKSVRCRQILRRTLATDGFRGIMALTLPEAGWLAEEFDDVLVGYPTADGDALRKLAVDEHRASRVTVMVDSPEHVEFVAEAARGGAPLRVCLDLDASLRLFGDRVHLGPRRSPVRSPGQARALAEAVLARPELRLIGLMAYEGQIAGVGDNRPGSPVRRAAIRAMQRASAKELRERRAEVVAAVTALAPLEFVNGGGTGSLESTASEPAITELGAGSGLYSPGLFDAYTGFRHHPSAFFVLPVVRRPAPDMVTVLGGGWVASGPVGTDRLPVPTWPTGLHLTATEGAGEAQTPLAGPGAAALGLGDRVWFRHAKAGELCERVDVLHLVRGDRIVDAVPTYRGEGRAFL
ncbi:amino acid deaminase/aldolase [Pseudonocardia eucalypti]|uniref:Amino acid deaminase/aldolase n=2 Tax=Pseudonocardia eucalypti TaxID=648755 RepID=A0ABP9RG49_9PSEU|nr:D-serine deaminase-like pyridoxal phosphate-dependent protein [Pseudonocardia eucalypti]